MIAIISDVEIAIPIGGDEGRILELGLRCRTAITAAPGGAGSGKWRNVAVLIDPADAIVIAITRGAPLIEVLHSHAKEARDFQRNQILSAAGKSEIAMMIPVVFLILPISILFALWPSLSSLNLFAAG